MNMKKTIAAIAAGAVAVSAMATTVSAVEAKTLNYNLTRTLEAKTNGKITMEATFHNVPLVAGNVAKIYVKGLGWTDKVVVSGQYIDTNKAINPMTFTRDIWSEGYSNYNEQLMGCAGPGSWGEMIQIPILAANTTNSAAFIGGAATATPGTPAVEEKVEAVYDNGTVKTTLTVNLADYKLNQATPGNDTLTFAADWDKQPAAYGITIPDTITPAAGDKITVTYTAPQTAVAGTTGPEMANIKVTVTLKGITDGDIETFNRNLQRDVYGISLAPDSSNDYTNDGTYIAGDAKGSGFTASTKYKAPFMTQLSDNDNIIAYLEAKNVNGDSKGYKNVAAVINDAIENYDGVTFTFNTAAAPVGFVYGTRNATVASGVYSSEKEARNALGDAIVAAKATYDDEYNKVHGAYNQAAVDTAKRAYDLVNGYQVFGIYVDNSWEGTDAYQAFGEHTYDWYYAPEGTGFTGYDWGGTNLFAGALVINEGYTMSLSNTEYFDWTKTSVSFDWEAIMDNAATTNNYATYIHSMKLATSSMWFWDSMDVVLTVGEADDVSADAGVTADDATLDDDDDDITADDDDDVEPADDDDDDEPAPVVDEPVAAPVVSNPPTGNAPVALAVIPVALAAAAIVAKKRG
ncbi:MAG: hypothetical protein K2J72_08840 [Oscillospiraceae bacterium]|nr:hypothetical protein [Oscillospiraceae bacterium]